MAPTLAGWFETYPVDAFWFADLAVIRSLTGFTGSAGQLLVRRSGETTLFVDGRYGLQAREQALGVEIVVVEKRFDDFVAGVQARGITRLGVEALAVTWDQVTRFGELAGPGVTLVPLREDAAGLRMRKSAEHVARVEAFIRVDDAAMAVFKAAVRPGATERELAWVLERAMREHGADEVSFPLIVLAGARSALIHGRPSDAVLKPGDILLVDHGVKIDGLHTDRTDTFVVGAPDALLAARYNAVMRAHDAAIAAIRPGVPAKTIDTAARDVLRAAGLAETFTHSTGHGVGLKVHEPPAVSKDNETVLEPGMVITVEPGVYIEGWGGIRIEDMVLVTDDGARILTTPRPPTITQLGV